VGIEVVVFTSRKVEDGSNSVVAFFEEQVCRRVYLLSFRAGRLGREQVQLYRYFVSSLVSFAAITLCVASQRVFVFVRFVIDSVRKLLDTPSYTK
jgi:hypothetical protein